MHKTFQKIMGEVCRNEGEFRGKIVKVPERSFSASSDYTWTVCKKTYASSSEGIDKSTRIASKTDIKKRHAHSVGNDVKSMPRWRSKSWEMQLTSVIGKWCA